MNSVSPGIGSISGSNEYLTLSEVQTVANYSALPDSAEDGAFAVTASNGRVYAYFEAAGVWIPAEWYASDLDFVRDSSDNPFDINPDSTVAGITAAGWVAGGTVEDDVNGIKIDGTNSRLEFGIGEQPARTKTGVILQCTQTGAVSSGWRCEMDWRDGTKRPGLLINKNSVNNRLAFRSSFNSEVSGALGVIDFSPYDIIFVEFNHSATDGSNICRAWQPESGEQMVCEYGSMPVNAGTDMFFMGYGSFGNTAECIIKRLQWLDLS